MDNPFSYPSLAFGAEAMQIGKELGRYNSFKNETTTPSTNERDTDPAVPTETTDTPPKGGQDLSGKWILQYQQQTLQIHLRKEVKK